MSDRTSFELTFTFDNNQVVRLNVDHEEGKAIGAINALRQAGGEEYIMSMLSALRHDPSIQAALSEANLGFADDDEEYL